jgi:Type I restriction modification DNA specificity domain
LQRPLQASGKISQRDLAKIEIPVPELDEQREIVSRVDSALRSIGEVSENVSLAWKLLQRLEGRLLSDAAAGK